MFHYFNKNIEMLFQREYNKCTGNRFHLRKDLQEVNNIMAENLELLTTESRNEQSMQIDTANPIDILRIMNEQDQLVAHSGQGGVTRYRGSSSSLCLNPLKTAGD